MPTYVVLHRRPGSKNNKVMYATNADSPGEAIRAVRKTIQATGDLLEVNGLALGGVAAQALGIKPGEVRRL